MFALLEGEVKFDLIVLLRGKILTPFGQIISRVHFLACQPNYFTGEELNQNFHVLPGPPSCTDNFKNERCSSKASVVVPGMGHTSCNVIHQLYKELKNQNEPTKNF